MAGWLEDEKIKVVYLLHDRGSNPDELAALQDKLTGPELRVVCPFLPHNNSRVKAEASYLWTYLNLYPQIVKSSLVVGLGLGGLIAAKLQEDAPTIPAICISSPTRDEELTLADKVVENRVALYSPEDKRIAGSCNWGKYAGRVYEVPWLLDHEPLMVRHSIAFLIRAFLQGKDLEDCVSACMF